MELTDAKAKTTLLINQQDLTLSFGFDCACGLSFATERDYNYHRDYWARKGDKSHTRRNHAN